MQGCQMVYFETKNTNFGMYILEGLGLEIFGVFHGHFVFLLPYSGQLGAFCGHLGTFPIFVRCTDKDLATLGQS
jgi:glyoxylate utilization-related uncharacterized protein